MITENDPRWYLFFDTETTGIPKDYRAPLTDFKNWPRLVQIAWVYQEAEQEPLTFTHIVKPSGFEIPEEASKIHGISTKDALKYGIPLEIVLNAFATHVERADLLVGHNVSFDRNIVGAEFHRMKLPDPLEGKGTLCTMMKSTQYCRIPKKGRGGYKWPTLHELHFTLFGKGFKDMHDARGDIMATVNCFWELRKKEVILL